MRTSTNGHSHDGIDPSLGYEPRDVSLRTLTKWIIGLYIFIFVTVAGTIPLYFLLVGGGGSEAAIARQHSVKKKLPEPVIQSHPIQDMGEFERQQHAVETSYGRVKSEPGKIHIPVERAMDKVLAEGLAAREGSAPPAPAGIYTPGDTTAPPTSETSSTPAMSESEAASAPHTAGPPGPPIQSGSEH